MKRFILFLSIFSLSFAAFAQMKPLENSAPLVKRMEQTASSLKSIESNFKQTKHIEAFRQDIVSSGRFFCLMPDKIRLNYSSPKSYSVVLNGDKMKMESGGKKNVMNLKDNRQLQEMRKLLTACMTGRLSSLSGDYQTKFFEDGQFYLITVLPLREDIKKSVEKFDIYLLKKDMSVDRLRIAETAGDYTEYQFSNKKINTQNNHSFFDI
jgi:outer membrane lipoprotein-sorting protein